MRNKGLLIFALFLLIIPASLAFTLFDDLRTLVNPPVVDASASPVQGEAPLTVHFECSASGGSPPYSYLWNFGDNEGEPGQSAVHTYAEPGTYNTICSILDSQGRQALDTVAITVSEPAAQCDDDRDNDGDGLIDYPADPGCSSSYDDDEGDEIPACSDNIDNDHDGKIDDQDPGCGSGHDNDEADPIVICEYDPHENIGLRVDFDLIENHYQGDTSSRVYAGSEVFQDNEYIPLVVNGIPIIDPTINLDVTGMALQRGEGYVKVALYGRHTDGVSKEISTSVARFINTRIELAVNGRRPEDRPWDGQGDGIFIPGRAGQDEYLARRGSRLAYLNSTVTTQWDTVYIYYDYDTKVGGGCEPLTVHATATPRSGTVPLRVSFSCSASGGSPPYSYLWNFGDNEGEPGQSAVHTYAEPGTYNTICSVLDSRGNQALDTVQITANAQVNHPPVAHAAAAPRSGIAPLSVNFAGSGTDIDGDYLTYRWIFGDGHASALQNPSHTYFHVGAYTATLTVTDEHGASDTDQVTIAVSQNSLPVAHLDIDPSSGIAPLTTTASCSASGGDLPLRYSLQFGDGSSPIVSDHPIRAVHTYSSGGTFQAACTVSDANSDSDRATATVTVTPDCNPHVRISVNPFSGTAPLTTRVTCTPSSGNPPYSYEVDFGDSQSVAAGPTMLPVSFLHTYTDPGTYDAVCSLTDSDGDPASAAAQVFVSSTVPPNARLTAIPLQGNAPLRVRFTGSYSYDPDGTIEQYRWDFGDGGTSYDADPIHTYYLPGTYTATLRVTDNDGLTASASVVITVFPVSEPNKTLDVQSIDCFPELPLGAQQSCEVKVTSDGVGVFAAQVMLKDSATEESLGACVTYSSGRCNVRFTPDQPGTYTVYATAHKHDYTPDLDKAPSFTYQITSPSYEVRDIRIFNDAAFVHEDYDFFRGERLYLSFQVVDGSTDQPVYGKVSKVEIISPAGGEATLAPKAGSYRYALLPIPTTHDFLGSPHRVRIELTNGAVSIQSVALMIRNNPPEIAPAIPDLSTDDDDPLSYSLLPFEKDVEDSGSDLAWSVQGSSAAFTASISGKHLRIDPINAGTGTITLTLTDLDGESDSQAVHVTIHSTNSPPTISVSLPDTVRTTDDIVCTGITSDPDNDQVTATYSFGGSHTDSGNAICSGNTCTAILDSSVTRKGDIIICSMTPFDGTDSGTPDTDRVIVSDSPPDMPLVVIHPSAPLPGEQLTCTATSNDPDGDQLSYIYSWFKDDVDQFITDRVLPAGITKKAETWRCLVVAFASGASSPPGSASVTIGDQGPSAPLVNILPEAPTSKDDLRCTHTQSIDPDGDAVHYSYQWRRNSALQPIVTDTVDSAFTSVGDIWQCTVTASSEGGSATGTDSVTITQSGPTIVSSPVTYIELTDDAEYRYDVNAVDPDDDVLTYFLLEGPAAMTINSATGLVQWVPTRLGSFPVTVFVQDPSGLSDSQSYTITVGEPRESPEPRDKVGLVRIDLLSGDCVTPGSTLYVLVTVENNGYYSMRHAKVSVSVPELALLSRAGPFIVGDGESATKRLALDIPSYADDGLYYLRVTAGDDDHYRVRYIDFVISSSCDCYGC